MYQHHFIIKGEPLREAYPVKAVMLRVVSSSALILKLRRPNICSDFVKLRPLLSNISFSSNAPNNEEAVETVEKVKKPMWMLPKTRVPKPLKYVKGQFLTRGGVDSFIELRLKDCNIAALSIFMTRSASRSEKTNSVTFLVGYFPLIQARLQSLASSPWTFWQIAATVSGLKCMKESDDRIVDIISIMARITKDSLARNEDVTPEDITLMMKGLGRIAGREEGSRTIFPLIAEAITKCTGEFTTAEIVKCIRYMQGKNTDYDEVRSLLYVLSEKLAAVQGGLTAVSISQVMFAAYRMPSDSKEVQNFLRIITDHSLNCFDEFDAQVVGDMIYGMQAMSSDCPEVKTLLQVILKKQVRGKMDIFPQTSSNALSGMKNLKSDSPEVREMLMHVVPNVEGTVKCFHPRALGDVLSGLQNMNSDCAEVRVLLKALVRHVLKGTGRMDGLSVSSALLGFKNMKDDCMEVRLLLKGLIRYVSETEGSLSEADIQRALSGLKGMSKESVEARMLIESLLAKVRSTEKVYDDDEEHADSPQVVLLTAALEVYKQ